MIQSITEFLYDNISDSIAKIKIEIDSYTFDKSGKTFNVNHWAIHQDGTRTHCLNQQRFRSHEQLQQLEDYIEDNFDFTGLNLFEKENKKIQIGLLIDVKTNLYDTGMTVWKLQPNDWELTPEQ